MPLFKTHWRCFAGCVFLALLLGTRPVLGGQQKAEDSAQSADVEHVADPPITPITGELGFWTIIVFLGVLFVLGKYAWGPLVSALDAREQYLRDAVAEAEGARDQAKALLAEHEQRMAEVQNEVRAIIDEARRDAQTTKDDIIKQAQSEAQSARDRARRDIEQARDQALKDLFDQTTELATGIASQIVRRSLNPEDHRDLVQQALKELPSEN